MRVAVIGAGVTGLVSAHRLAAAGHAVDVYERWPGLGGQAATMDVGEGHRIERYYHHLFTTDRHIAALYAELGLPREIEWHPSSIAVFRDGRSHAFTTPLDLLRFAPLSVRSRLRMGWATLRLRRAANDLPSFDRETARRWIERTMGEEVYERLWGPLLRAKFGDRAEDLSMAWLWSKLTLRRRIRGREARRELLGYPRSSFESLFERLRTSIETGAGRVMIDRPVARLAREGGRFVVVPSPPGSFRRGHDPRRFDHERPEAYDAVIATVPSDVFERLLDPDLTAAVGERYLGRVHSIEYQAALCLVLELDRPFSEHYWTNVADPELPFLGLIEHTNLVGAERYGGRRFLYVANYTAQGDPLLALPPDDLLAAYEPGLRRMNPSFSRTWIRRRWLFSEPAAQPVVTLGYHQRIPPLETGVPGLVLANTTQVYPEDRGTNYAVRLGDRAAATLLRDSAARGPRG